MAKYFHLWKQFECVAESGPQLILQFYILAISSDDRNIPNYVGDVENTTLIYNTVPGNFNTSLQWTSVNPTFNVSVQLTTNEPTGINNIDKTFTLVLQILVIISALFSLSWSSVTLKRDDDKQQEENTTLIDYFLELMWNIMCISSRVIALALFASVQRYWFAGLISCQVVLFFILFFFKLIRSERFKIHTTDKFDFFLHLLLIIILGTNSVFNIFLPVRYYDRMPLWFFVNYWLLMMIENTVIITIWYTTTSGTGLWYHEYAISYVIIAYVLSFILKIFQASMRDYNHVGDDVKGKMKHIKLWDC